MSSHSLMHILVRELLFSLCINKHVIKGCAPRSYAQYIFVTAESGWHFDKQPREGWKIESVLSQATSPIGHTSVPFSFALSATGVRHVEFLGRLPLYISSQTPVPLSPFPVSRYLFSVSRFPFPVSRLPFAVCRFPFPVSRFPFPVSRFPFPVPNFSYILFKCSLKTAWHQD